MNHSACLVWYTVASAVASSFFLQAADNLWPQRPNQHIMQKLQDHIPVIKKLRDVGGTAGAAIGVSISGQAPFTLNLGHRDVENNLPTESTTIYPLGSLTKAFTAAVCAKLVSTHVLSWDTAVTSYLPELSIESDPALAGQLTLTDLLSHRTGLAREDALWLGAENEVLVNKSDTVAIINGLRSVFPLRSKWLYNNWMYALVGEIIERVTGQKFNDILMDLITEPIQLPHTTGDVENIPTAIQAQPYMVYDDKSLLRVRQVDLKAGNLMATAGGIRSCVDDMILWTQALMSSIIESQRHPVQSTDGPIQLAQDLFSGHTVMTASPANDELYTFGWAKVLLASQFGKMGFNPGLVDAMPMVGGGSQSELVFYHNGGLPGFNHCIMMIPSRGISIIVLTNSISHGDTADWIAQSILQVILDLDPKVDYLELATESAARWLNRYPKMEKALEERRVPNTTQAPAEEFVGTYWHTSGAVQIDVSVGEDGKLVFVVNRSERQTHKLSHFNYDTFTFFPSRRELMERALLSYGAAAWLLHFQRSENNTISSIKWQLDASVKEGDIFTKETK